MLEDAYVMQARAMWAQSLTFAELGAWGAVVAAVSYCVVRAIVTSFRGVE